jgi:hypothetical protein
MHNHSGIKPARQRSVVPLALRSDDYDRDSQLSVPANFEPILEHRVQLRGGARRLAEFAPLADRLDNPRVDRLELVGQKGAWQLLDGGGRLMRTRSEWPMSDFAAILRATRWEVVLLPLYIPIAKRRKAH